MACRHHAEPIDLFCYCFAWNGLRFEWLCPVAWQVCCWSLTMTALHSSSDTRCNKSKRPNRHGTSSVQQLPCPYHSTHWLARQNLRLIAPCLNFPHDGLAMGLCSHPVKRTGLHSSPHSSCVLAKSGWKRLTGLCSLMPSSLCRY